MFEDWKGTVEVNGKPCSVAEIPNILQGGITIHLFPKGYVSREKVEVTPSSDETVYRVYVKEWLTKKSTPSFDFMAKFNKDVPMPLREMIGTIDSETPKMYQMTLHGDILATVTDRCMCCGRPITNAVSRYFGIGPVCGGHNYVNPFSTDEELKAEVRKYRTKLQQITWHGWIPKSAIVEKEVYNG